MCFAVSNRKLLSEWPKQIRLCFLHSKQSGGRQLQAFAQFPASLTFLAFSFKLLTSTIHSSKEVRKRLSSANHDFPLIRKSRRLLSSPTSFSMDLMSKTGHTATHIFWRVWESKCLSWDRAHCCLKQKQDCVARKGRGEWDWVSNWKYVLQAC